MEKKLRCKDFDAYVSFLGRLAKIGAVYIIKNDIMITTKKGVKPKTGDNIPGRHLIRDPFFVDDEEGYVLDGVYVPNRTVTELITIFKNVKTDNTDNPRSEITLVRNKTEYYIRFANGYRVDLFNLATEDRITEEGRELISKVADNLGYFSEFIKNVPNGWVNIPQNDIIDMRDNALKILRQDLDDVKCWARVTRSVFIMAGVVKVGMSFADNIDYTFIHSNTNQRDTALLRIHALYKSPGNSNMIKVDCIHEYVVLIYDDSKE